MRIHKISGCTRYPGFEEYEIKEEEWYDAFGDTFVEVWYWYATAHYEGDGEAIAVDAEGKWWTADLGHCSCYGPMGENYGCSEKRQFTELSPIFYAQMTDERKAELENLMVEVRKDPRWRE